MRRIGEFAHDAVVARPVLKRQEHRIRPDQPAVLGKDVPDLVRFGEEEHHIRRFPEAAAFIGGDHSCHAAAVPPDRDALLIDLFKVCRIAADQGYIRACGQFPPEQQSHRAGSDHCDLHGQILLFLSALPAAAFVTILPHSAKYRPHPISAIYSSLVYGFQCPSITTSASMPRTFCARAAILPQSILQEGNSPSCASPTKRTRSSGT